MAKIRVAIVGATGYTGAELARLLLGHPDAEIVSLVGQSKAGQPVERVLPALAGIVRGEVEAFDADSVAERAQVAFCGLPHGASAPIVAQLRERGVKVFDLSADFRLTNRAVHAEWYGQDQAPELAGEAVYGLPELHREALRSADLVAVPGCYPTATILPLAPLYAEGLIEDGPVIVDAKSGVSGAGRAPSERTHFSETTEGIRGYKIAGDHRHTPEIEQELSRVAKRDVRITFTPHLVPMTRGILATAYLRLRPGVDAARCTAAARAMYEGSPSVHVLETGACPDTLWVRGSNRAHLSYALDARTGTLIAQGAIDNLVKGASGQAVQCMNVRFGLAEAAGLAMPAAWP